MIVRGKGMSVTASIGVTTVCPDPDGDHQTLMASADEALYRAKAGGRNRVNIE